MWVWNCAGGLFKALGQTERRRDSQGCFHLATSTLLLLPPPSSELKVAENEAVHMALFEARQVRKMKPCSSSCCSPLTRTAATTAAAAALPLPCAGGRRRGLGCRG